jgi:hypothetical protein
MLTDDVVEGEPLLYLEVEGPRVSSGVDVIRIAKGLTTQHVLTLEPDGSVRYVPALAGPEHFVEAEGAQLNRIWNAVLFRNQSVKDDVCDEFERILNMHGLREAHLQEFLEAHPELLLGDEFELAVPQVTLSTHDGDLRPDFILRPLAGLSSEAKIIELKLPGQRVLKPRPVKRPALYAAVNEAVAQLRAYGRYFDDAASRQALTGRLGFYVYRPRLTLVVGRSQGLPSDDRRADALASIAPVELVTYDDLAVRYRRLASIRREAR